MLVSYCFPSDELLRVFDIFLSVCSYNTHAVMYFKKGDSRKPMNVSKLIPKKLDENNSCENNLYSHININII